MQYLFDADLNSPVRAGYTVEEVIDHYEGTKEENE
jgi:hypothetical protein